MHYNKFLLDFYGETFGTEFSNFADGILGHTQFNENNGNLKKLDIDII